MPLITDKLFWVHHSIGKSSNFWSWAPDSKSFIIGEDNDGDERYQLFQISLNEPTKRIPVTDPTPDYFLHGGQLTPDNETLVYAINYNVEKAQEIEETWVYRHDRKTNKRTAIAKPQRHADVEPQLNLQGTHILYNRNDLDPSGSQLWLVSLNGINDQEILNFGASVKVEGSWLPDSKRIIFLVEQESYRKVGVYHIETRAIDWILDDPTHNIEDAYVPYGSHEAVIIEIKSTNVHASRINLHTHTETAFAVTNGNLWPVAPTPAGWIGVFSRSNYPSDLISFDSSAGDESQFRSITGITERMGVVPQKFVKATDFRWQSVDGLEIQGWLYQTKNAQGTIVIVHGGPTSHSKNAFSTQIQYYVSRGFTVFEPNYRGSTGFNLAFQEAIKKTGWGGLEQEDIRTGITALIANGIAQRGKIGITGTSYGGYSSWYAITHFPKELIAAAAPICGMTDLVVDYNTTRPDLRAYSEEMIGGSPTQVPERYFAGSPINFVQNIQGKLLIIQGLQDPNVTPDNVTTVENALKLPVIYFEVQPPASC